jgi:hypothetical protein
MPGASNPFDLLAGARADGKPRKKAAQKATPSAAPSAVAAPPRAAPATPPQRPASPPPRATEVAQWTAVAPGAAAPRSTAKKGAKGKTPPAAAAAPGSAFATLLALSPDDDDDERNGDGAPATCAPVCVLDDGLSHAAGC